VLGVDSSASGEELERAFRETDERLAKQGAQPWIRQAARDSFKVLTQKQPAEKATQKHSSGVEQQTDAQQASMKTPRWSGLGGELLLQNEMSYFILVSVLDFFLTYLLLNLGAIEANPLANFLYQQFDFAGMLAFKLIVVAIVCIVTQVIAHRKPAYGRFVIWTGIIVTGAVVIYSTRLLTGQLN
jgi:hypothetical protein